MLLFIFETERDRAWAWEGQERGRHRIWSGLQALSCQYRAQCGGSNSQSVRSWPELKSYAQRTEPPSCPLMTIFNPGLWLEAYKAKQDNCWSSSQFSEKEGQHPHSCRMGQKLLADIWLFFLFLTSRPPFYSWGSAIGCNFMLGKAFLHFI